jgi:putative pyruvate formate lyase activating enzyme
MHWFIRPDALYAFEEDGVKRALGRYVVVSRDEKTARFMIAKTIPAGIDLDVEGDRLWEEHDKGVKKLRRCQKKFDSQNMKIEDLEFQRPSLLDIKIKLANRILESCHFCERRCGVNRAEGEKGFCNLDKQSRLSTEFLHMGEEACLVPSHTFFFIGCSFYCIYCQNWSISRQFEKGVPIAGKDLARLAKRRRITEKSRNINLVGGSPTPNTHTIMEMLGELDVNVPVVWNSNMYMSIETMKLLDGCVDVYLADFKYGNDECARRLSKIRNYWEVTTRNHLSAREQAEVLIRHLVLPNHVECCSRPVLEWIAENLGNDVRVNIMAQYRPEFEAHKMPGITRRVTEEEMKEVYSIAKENGLTNLD